jgi:hypothetical protein
VAAPCLAVLLVWAGLSLGLIRVVEEHARSGLALELRRWIPRAARRSLDGDSPLLKFCELSFVHGDPPAITTTPGAGYRIATQTPHQPSSPGS